MAHRGRPYPVAFRRDFNQYSNIANGHAFPLKWHVVVHSGVVPVYPLDGSVWVCGPDVYIPDGLLQWSAPVQHIAGVDYQLRVQLLYTNLPDSLLVAHFLFVTNPTGYGFYWIPREPVRDDPFSFVSGEARTFDLDHTLYPRGGFFQNSNWAAVGY